jgi:hypothetical protein
MESEQAVSGVMIQAIAIAGLILSLSIVVRGFLNCSIDTGFLVLLCLIFGVVGFSTLTVMTQGVGIIAIGCFFGILIRVTDKPKSFETFDGTTPNEE